MGDWYSCCTGSRVRLGIQRRLQAGKEYYQRDHFDDYSGTHASMVDLFLQNQMEASLGRKGAAGTVLSLKVGFPANTHGGDIGSGRGVTPNPKFAVSQ